MTTEVSSSFPLITGGDPGITESLSRMYREEGPEKASRGTFGADLLEYMLGQTPSRARVAGARFRMRALRFVRTPLPPNTSALAPAST